MNLAWEFVVVFKRPLRFPFRHSACGIMHVIRHYQCFHAGSQELAELKEREELEAQGFSDWNRSEYIKFVKACEKFGRDQLQQITDEVGTKNFEEVKLYAGSFWSRGAQCIGDFDKIVKRVEEGERKILEKAKMAEVRSYRACHMSQSNPSFLACFIVFGSRFNGGNHGAVLLASC